MSRRIALVSVGMLLPVTGGAVVYAATDAGRPPSRSPESGHAVRHRAPATRSSRPPADAAGPRRSAPPTRTPAPSASPTAPAAPRIGFAPYADVLKGPLPHLTGVRDYTMGFVTAGDGCSAGWDGRTAIDSAPVLREIKDVPGKVIVSFGGPSGTEPARNCGNADELAERYGSVLKATHPDGIDFYLTEGALGDTASTRRRAEALTRVKDLPQVSMTLPLHRTGLSAAALGALRSAAAGGATVSIVNLVPADGPGQSITASATAAHGQLERLYGKDDAQAWRRMGVTPTIGVARALFGTEDARQLLSWATARGLGRLSMWSVTRDTPCTVTTSVTAGTCSGLDEDTGAFAQILRRF